MKDYLHKLNYSSVNEDSCSEFRALEITHNDRILCITGSGARTLDLLTNLPDEIVSIDINPCQNYLLELKIAAIKKLNYNEFIRFIGIVKSTKRLDTYNELIPLLSESAKTFWNNNNSMIKRGILYQGEWEKYFGMLAKILQLTRKKTLSRLFECETIDQQKNVWISSWKNISWNYFIKAISSKQIWKYLFGDPGFYRYVPKGFSIATYFIEKFDEGVSKCLFKKSPFLNILFYKKLTMECLPPHLQKENYDVLKAGINRIKIITDSVEKYLLKNECKYDCFSLSDVSSYTSVAEYERLFNYISKRVNKNARVCERQFLVKRNLPVNISDYFMRNKNVEQEIENSDNSLFYSFHCYKLK